MTGRNPQINSQIASQPSAAFRHVQLVCFDLGGVLVRVCRTWKEACHAANVPLRPSPLDEPAGFAGVIELVERYQVGMMDCDAFAAQYSSLTDGAYSPREVRAVHDAWLRGEYDGVVNVIDALHARGIETAALSNTNAAHWAGMADYPTMQRLRHPLASHLLRLAKPDPAIYRAAEQRLGVSGESILFFDDLEENVRAARDVGWNACQIDPHGCPATQMTDMLRATRII